MSDTTAAAPSDELVPDEVIPHRTLPPLQYRDMPAPISWRKMLGPSIMLAGLSLGLRAGGDHAIFPQHGNRTLDAGHRRERDHGVLPAQPDLGSRDVIVEHRAVGLARMGDGRRQDAQLDAHGAGGFRRGRIRGVHSLRDGAAEVLEAEALETSSLVGKPLRDVRLPDGIIVGAVVRGERVIIPRGNTVIEVNDRVVMFALADMVRRVEKMFSVRLDFF